MKYSELVNENLQRLSAILATIKRQQVRIRFTHAKGEQKDTSSMAKLRRDVARVKTAMVAARSRLTGGVGG